MDTFTLLSAQVTDLSLTQERLADVVRRAISAATALDLTAVESWREAQGRHRIDPLLLAYAPRAWMNAVPGLVGARDVSTLIERFGPHQTAVVVADLPMARSRRHLDLLWSTGRLDLRLLVLAVQDLEETPLDWLEWALVHVGAQALLDHFSDLAWCPSLVLETIVRAGRADLVRRAWYATPRKERNESAPGALLLAAQHDPAVALDMFEHFLRTSGHTKLLGASIAAIRGGSDESVVDALEDLVATSPHLALFRDEINDTTGAGAISWRLASRPSTALAEILKDPLDAAAASTLVVVTGSAPSVIDAVLDANPDLLPELLSWLPPEELQAPALVTRALARFDGRVSDLLVGSLRADTRCLANLSAWGRLEDSDLLALSMVQTSLLPVREIRRLSHLLLPEPDSDRAEVVTALLRTYTGSAQELLTSSQELV